MTALYFWSVTAHVLAAVVWIGGMLFVALAAPTLRRATDEHTRARLFDALGRSFRRVAWICIAVLLATGVLQMRLRGWWGADVLGAARFWSTPPGATLARKLLLVAALLVVEGVHDFRLGPRAGRAQPGSDAARALRIRAAWLARLGAALALGVLFFAVRLARGG